MFFLGLKLAASLTESDGRLCVSPDTAHLMLSLIRPDTANNSPSLTDV